MSTHVLSWTRRDAPLDPVAVTCRPDHADELLSATLRRVLAGHELRVATGPGGSVVLGAGDALPWFAGAVYLGWDRGVLVPTSRAPSLPVDLLLASLRDRLPEGHGLVAVLPWAVLAAPMPVAVVDAAAVEALARSRGRHNTAVEQAASTGLPGAAGPW
ncbi:MAG TPA: hypothetical protein VFP72_18785 [Kineosporiaceae bacterium]|nr:hypothetical protein [Kineosporiaceae bacterium]